MKISLKRNKLYFSPTFFIDLDRKTIDEYNLKKRTEISEIEYKELITQRAYSMAYFLLARREMSSKKLKDKLIEKYKERKIIENLIEDFTQKGYLDDTQFAELYIRSHPNYSKKKMFFSLSQMGIDRDTINSFLGKYDEKDEIIRQWERLGNKDYNKKIMSLMRKGFNYRTIREVIDDL